MNPDEIFDMFPELLAGSYRNQMLLGTIPAETVGSVLGPLLAHFWDVMLKLSPDLQTDFQNILRIYPEVAARFGLRMKPPIEKSLPVLAAYLRRQARDFPSGEQAGAALDLAAEEQEELDASVKPAVIEGQGFFETDKGNSVYIEFSFREGEDFIVFSRKPVEMAVDIHLWGGCALTLRRGEVEIGIETDKLLAVCKEGVLPGKIIKVVEREETGPPGDV
ncbi:MAG: hypothetical protein WAW37_03490 [Syntrophobacteraceae bacterium]